MTNILNRQWTAALLVTTLALAALVAWRYSRPREKNYETFKTQQQKDDFATLSSSNPAATNLFGAMIRMAQENRPIARTAALGAASNENPFLRSASVRSLAYFDDDASWSAMKILCTDRDSTVRSACLASAFVKKTPERKTFFQSEFLTRARDDEEKLQAMIVMAQMDHSERPSAEAIGEILRFASRRPALETRAVSELLRLAPHDPQVVVHLREYIKASSHAPSAIRSLAVRHLAQIHDGNLADNFNGIISDADFAVRIAALQAMVVLCPANRWPMLERKIRDDPNESVRREALNVVGSMPSEDASVLLDRLSNAPKLTDSLREQIREIRGKASQNLRVDPCLGKTKAL